MFGVGCVSLLSLELYWNMLLSTMLQGKVGQTAIYTETERHIQVQVIEEAKFFFVPILPMTLRQLNGGINSML